VNKVGRVSLFLNILKALQNLGNFKANYSLMLNFVKRLFPDLKSYQ